MCNVRDKCELCRKPIYIHDVALVCTYDTKIYHAKCLKIDRTTAHELQNAPEWFCPCCLENIFPFFNSVISCTINNPDKCLSCAKFISSRRDKVSKCLLCDEIFHFNCLPKSKICISCFHNTNFLCESINLNMIFKSDCFNPYSVLELDEENHDRSMFIMTTITTIMSSKMTQFLSQKMFSITVNFTILIACLMIITQERHFILTT